jgi:hypothetical protein
MSAIRGRRRTAGDRPTVRERSAVAFRRGTWGVARLITLVASLVAAVIVIGIVLVVLGANKDNTIVNALLDAARFLAGPFKNMFNLSHHKTEVAVNYGIAAVVYLVAGNLLARLIRR